MREINGPSEFPAIGAFQQGEVRPALPKHIVSADKAGTSHPVPARKQASIVEGYFGPTWKDRTVAKLVSEKMVREGVVDERNTPAGENPKYFTLYDSPLENTDSESSSNENNGQPASYGKSFEGIPPDYKSLKEYLDESLPEHPVGIDIGGTGSKLFRGFDKPFALSLGLTLVDRRDPATQQLDASRGHGVIEGDIQSNAVKEAVKRSLDGRQADVMFLRMGAGADYLEQNPYAMADHFNDYYQFLSAQNGKMFVEVPKLLLPLTKQWTWKVGTEFEGRLGIVSSPYLEGYLELEKLPDAPEDIRDTMLPARDVRDTYDVFFGKKFSQERFERIILGRPLRH